MSFLYVLFAFLELNDNKKMNKIKSTICLNECALSIQSKTINDFF